MESKLYNQAGKEVGSVKIPESVFGLPWNADLVHQVAVSMQANQRHSVAHVKDRGAVRGGGKKPWRQKGTGRARHGSIRSPLWVGGGVTHGPNKDKVFARTVTKSMKAKALRTVLSRKFKEGELLFVDNVAFSVPKTKEARAVMTAWGGIKGFESIFTKKTNMLHLALSGKNVSVERAFRNLKGLSVGALSGLNVLTLLRAKYVAIVNPNESLKFFNEA